ncbi:MAG: hypothetical protein JO257_03510 [Deltaproteobacteria bacterium]|nr:hypothetical protein [Deltaproteobacteria bacterium]
MHWRDEWRQLSMRMNAWRSVAETFLANQPGLINDWKQLAPVSDALVRDAQQLMLRVRRLVLPEPFRSQLKEALERTDGLSRHVEGPNGVLHQLLVHAALRAPVDEAYLNNDEQRRALVERAFLHLNRTLSIDDTARERWRDAFTFETRCEKLGALHLLSHGVYAFKAEAGSGRTDLVLGTPLHVGDDVRSASMLVLTEWKLVRPGDDPNEIARVGRRQVERYSHVELSGFELRDARYVVLVSPLPLPMPATETVGSVMYKYINVVIEPPRPSDWARRPDAA